MDGRVLEVEVDAAAVEAALLARGGREEGVGLVGLGHRLARAGRGLEGGLDAGTPLSKDSSRATVRDLRAAPPSAPMPERVEGMAPVVKV